VKDIRKMYKFEVPSKILYFCSECGLNPIRKGSYNLYEVNTGTCCQCGYERDREVVILEKVVRLDNEIKESVRLIQEIRNTSREVMIDELILHRTKQYEDEFKELNDPVDIRRKLQFSLVLDKETATDILEKQIKKIKQKREELLSQIKSHPA